MNRNNIIIVSVVLILLAVASFYAGDYRVTGIDEQGTTEWKDAVCEIDSDCVNYFLELGASQTMIDDVVISCGSNDYCLTREK